MNLYPRLFTTVTAMEGRVGAYPSVQYSTTRVVHHSADTVDALTPDPPVPVIQQDRNRCVTLSLESLAGYLTYTTDWDRHEIRRRMVELGKWISDHLLPINCFCCLCGSLPRTVEVLTDQHDIPWELAWVDGGFLSEKSIHARYPFVGRVRSSAAVYNDPPRVAIIVGQTRGLCCLDAEIAGVTEAMRAACGAVPTVYRGDVVDVQLVQDIVKGYPDPFDVIHFIGHGNAQSNQVWLELPQSPFLDSYVPTRLAGNPVVFWNACRSAASTAPGYKYQADVLDAFGSRLLSAGASHFIGSLFPVLDTTASRFAVRFYSGIFARESVGEALFNGKAAIADDDPLVHTYVLYGSPSARMVHDG